MRDYSFKVVIQKEPEDEGYYAYIPSLPGCNSGGLTLEETRANIQEALEGVLASMQAHGDPIPEDDVSLIVEVVRVAA